MKNLLFTLALLISFSSFGQIEPNNSNNDFSILTPAQKYFKSAYDKSDLKDYKGAIADYTKAIELNPDFYDAYFNRGLAKNNLKDHYGGISDYTKVIEVDPNFGAAYNYRGIAKIMIDMDNDAITDFTKAIELDPVSYNADNVGRFIRGFALNELPWNTEVEYLNISDFPSLVDHYGKSEIKIVKDSYELKQRGRKTVISFINASERNQYGRKVQNGTTTWKIKESKN